MAKIYNEVVIDMNPESPTFEETLYEDSYEYSGDIILAQLEAPQHEGEEATIGTGGTRKKDPDDPDVYLYYYKVINYMI